MVAADQAVATVGLERTSAAVRDMRFGLGFQTQSGTHGTTLHAKKDASLLVMVVTAVPTRGMDTTSVSSLEIAAGVQVGTNYSGAKYSSVRHNPRKRQRDRRLRTHE